MLPDKFFFWPYPTESLQAAVEDITPLLLKSGLAKWVRCKEGNLAEFIALECRAWNINPWLLMVAAQREQSSLTTQNMTDIALVAWLGVVGQDIGRTGNPGFLGVYPQVSRACEVYAWLLGKESSDHWPDYWRTRKTSQRWRIGRTLPVEGAPVMVNNVRTPGKEGVTVDYMPVSAGEYAQLAYTPHWKVLATNEAIANKFAPMRYLTVPA